MELNLDLYQTMALAVVVYYLGSFLRSKVKLFRDYCIPAPVIGGIIFALVNLVLYETGIVTLGLDTSLQSTFMNIFFTSVGFSASISVVKRGGKALLVFIVCIAILGIVQTMVGAGLCQAFGIDRQLGIALGTMSLTGGHGTSAAFAPLLEEKGIANATTVAVAAATWGLVAGNAFGNPIARRRIQKMNLAQARTDVNAGDPVADAIVSAAEQPKLDAGRGILALSLLFVAMGIGTLFSLLFAKLGITFASYVGALIVGIIIRNICDSRGVEIPVTDINVIGTISLSFFLVLAMMGLKLYQLADLAVPMIVILLVQTVISALVVYFVTFGLMGRDYDAAVLTTGHYGFGMGATPNAMANMDALTSTYGPSEKAYLIIPICGGFLTDIVNVFLITFFMGVL